MPDAGVQVYMMADGRFYNPSTGISGLTREEALGTPNAGGTGGQSGQTGAGSGTGGQSKDANGDGIADDVTATIQSLFPESDSLVNQYQSLRKSSGIEADEAALNAVNQEVADMNATIQNIEDEVRAQAGGMADESFIQATVADRLRRLMPRINQLNARQQSLTTAVENKRASLTEQLGFSQADIENSRQERQDLRTSLQDLISAYGSKVFDGMAPEMLKELERRAGLPLGFISARAKTIDEQKLAQANQLNPSDIFGSGDIGNYSFYSAQEKSAGRTPISFDAWLTQDANRKRAVTISNGMSTQQASQFLNVTNKFQADPIIMKAIDANVVSSIMDSVIADPKNPTNQLNVLYGYVKALDPDSAVREGELSLAQSAQSYLQRFSNSMARLASGKILDEKTAVAMAEATKELAKARQAAASNRESFYSSQAGSLGFGGEFTNYLSGINLPYKSGGSSEFDY